MNTWNIDQAHSVIGFKVKHLLVSTVRGEFTDFEGKIEAADDTFENAAISFTAQATSISTHSEARDNHLRSADFFEVEKYPTLSFTSKSFTKKGDAFELVGDFMMHGVTKEISLEVTTEGVGKGMNGESVVGFDITGTLNRHDYGLTWNALVETGGAVVSDTVTLDIHIEAVKA
jgi:polyisoprenoid-binding protein YceI